MSRSFEISQNMLTKFHTTGGFEIRQNMLTKFHTTGRILCFPDVLSIAIIYYQAVSEFSGLSKSSKSRLFNSVRNFTELTQLLKNSNVKALIFFIIIAYVPELFSPYKYLSLISL